MAHCSATIYQQVTLSGDADWTRVADAMIEAIMGMALRQNEAKAHRHAIAVPRRHQQHEAQTKKPGMMLADPPFLHHGILGAAFGRHDCRRQTDTGRHWMAAAR